MPAGREGMRPAGDVETRPPDGTKPGSKWHEVTVQVGDGKAKTIRGYYP